MSAVVKLNPPQPSLIDEGETVEVDEQEIARAAQAVFDEMVDGNCSLRDAITAVYLAGMERITGAKPAKRSKKPAVPPCPYTAIVELYHRHLHELPSVQMLGPDRKAGLRRFWVWIFESRRPDGSRRAENVDGAMNWISLYFGRAAENDFIMGRSRRSAEHQGWKADIDYLVSLRGIKQVVEKTEATS